MHLGISGCLGDKITHTLHTVLSCTGVGESRSHRPGIILAADESRTLGFRHRDAHLLETGQVHMVGDQGLPSHFSQLIHLLFITFGNVALCLQVVVNLKIFRISDLRTVDHADLGVVARKSHIRFKRENECQQCERDDNRQNHTESGP